MTENDLKKLGKAELLEMLEHQMAETHRLEEENINLRKQLEKRRIAIDESGSIAEASIKINKVFEAAQAAADEYLDNVRQNNSRHEQLVERAEALAREKVTQMITEADERCRRMEDETSRKCDTMTRKAMREADAYWVQVSVKLDAYLKQHSDLKTLLTRDFPKVGQTGFSDDSVES